MPVYSEKLSSFFSFQNFSQINDPGLDSMFKWISLIIKRFVFFGVDVIRYGLNLYIIIKIRA